MAFSPKAMPARRKGTSLTRLNSTSWLAGETERRYVLDVVLCRWLGLAYELHPEDRTDVRLTLKGDPTGGSLSVPEVLFASDRQHWLTTTSLPRSPLPRRPVGGPSAGALGADELLPVIYGPRDVRAVLWSTQGESSIELSVDIFGSAFFMLTRLEEVVIAARDRYGRFPASESLAYRERFLNLPIVDAYVELLWGALASLWPRLQRRRRPYRLLLTHDVDRPLAFLGHSRLGLVRQLGADVVIRRDPSLAAKRVRSWAAIARGDPSLDPYNTFDFLMSMSERQGIMGAFYFLAPEHPNARTEPYTLDHPWIESLMSTIYRRGHEIGFHGSFDSYSDRNRTADEFDRLRRAASKLGISQCRWGGRQHYLRWDPDTWSSWEEAGLDYDSTGFADSVGFRFGTCHEFQTFDLRERRPLRLQEWPLTVMDATAFEYMKLGADAAFREVVELARQCRRFQGTLTLLWHNSSLPSTGQQRWYEALTEAVACPQ